MQRLFHTLPNLRNFLNSFLHPCFLFPDPNFPESTVLYKEKTAGSLLTKFSNHIRTPSAPMFLFLALQMIGNSCHAHLRDTLKNANFYALRQWICQSKAIWVIEFHAVMGCRTEINTAKISLRSQPCCWRKASPFMKKNTLIRIC